MSELDQPILSFKIVTIFPQIFPNILSLSCIGNALKKNIWSLEVYDLKDWGIGKHKKVDDKIYGGGSGMLMRADVIGKALDFLIQKFPKAKIIYPSPRGTVFNQNTAREFILESQMIILCGRFEGIDQRIIEEYNIQEISMGDFILSGGEIAAFSIIDSCVRLLPGVILESSKLEESFGEEKIYNNLLEYPQYTLPRIWKEKEVPTVLLSGDHKRIKDWRISKSEAITREKRTDLWKEYSKDNKKY